MLELGADMSDGVPVGTVRQVHGRSAAGAVLDVRQADADGAHEGQLDVDEARLRGAYTSTSTGAHCVRTIAPLGYRIPMDGRVGELISRTDISHYRPAHVHFLVDVPGHERLVTLLFPRSAQYLDADEVFGVKDQLVVEFERRQPGHTPDGRECNQPWPTVRYDFVQQPTNPGDDVATPSRQAIPLVKRVRKT